MKSQSSFFGITKYVAIVFMDDIRFFKRTIFADCGIVPTGEFC